MIVTIAASIMKARANWRTAPTLPMVAANQSAPAASTNAMPGHHGVAVRAATTSRSRQASHRQIGTTTKPWTNVSDRAQMATIDAAVCQYTASIATTAAITTSTGKRSHDSRLGAGASVMGDVSGAFIRGCAR
jgi:hypothetical protein